jgi:hypothetical protein
LFCERKSTALRCSGRIDFEHSSYELNRPEAKRFRVKLANLNIPKIDLIEVFVDLLEAENLNWRSKLCDRGRSSLTADAISY